MRRLATTSWTVFARKRSALTAFVDNVLDMTRLESGATAPGAVTRRHCRTLGLAVADMAGISAATEIALVMARRIFRWRVSIRFCLRHVLGNLDRTTPEIQPGRHGDRCLGAAVLRMASSSRLPIRAGHTGERRCQAIFDRFMRVPQDDRRRAGTGLGRRHL